MKKNASFKWYVFLGRQTLRKTIILSVDGKKKKKIPGQTNLTPSVVPMIVRILDPG